MSLKLDKRMLLVLAVLMMLAIIPISFAEDIDDANVVGVNNASVVDAVAESAVDADVINNDSSDNILSAGESDVLGSGEDYITSPQTSSITYNSSASQSVVFTATYDTTDSGGIAGSLSDADGIYVFVNDEDPILLSESTTNTQYTVILKNYDEYFKTGDNQLYVGFSQSDVNFFENYYSYSLLFNPLTVTVTDSRSGSGEDPVDNAIYVDSNSGSGGSGTSADPYHSISTALSNAKSGVEIKFLAGTYNINQAISLSKNIQFTAIGEVIFTGTSTNMFSGSTYTITFNGIKFKNGYSSSNALIYHNTGNNVVGTLNFNYCDFIGNTAPSLIKSSCNLNIKGCNFIDNTLTGTSRSTGGLFENYYTTNSIIDISYSNFITNDIRFTNNGYTPIVADDNNGDGPTIKFNYNYIGSNSKIADDAISNHARITNGDYTIISGAVDDEVTVGDTANLNIKFVASDGSDLSDNMANLTVTLQPTLLSDPITVTVSNNIGVGEYSATTEGSEIVDIKVNDATVDTFTFEVEEIAGGTVFVDSNAADGGDGSKPAPYKTIGEAIERANEGDINVISVKEGNYELEEGAMIMVDTSIVGKGNVVIKSTSFMTMGAVSLTNLVFDGGVSPVQNNGGDLTITGCVFINNSGDFVIGNGGSTTISYTIFANNDVENVIQNEGSSLITDYNFWGSNDADGFDNPVILSLDMSDEIYTGGDYPVVLKFTDTDGNDLSSNLHDFTVSLEAIGTTTPSEVTISKNTGNANYNSASAGSDELKVKIGSSEILSKEFTALDDDTSKIYVDATRGVDESGRGSKAKPYKTIQYAFTQASSGDEIAVFDGVYDFASSLTLNKNIKISAVGDNAVLKGAGFSSIISASYSYNVQLVGFTFINGGGTISGISGSSSYGSYGSLKVINCTFANSSATYNVIRSYVSTEITGCTFINNTITSYSSSNGFKGLLSFSTATSTVNNNIFIDNTLVNANALMVESFSSASVNINNNYWGSNGGLDSSKYSSSGVTYANWAIMEVSQIAGDVYVPDEINLAVSFKSNSGSALTGNLVNKHIAVKASYGSVNPASTSFDSNQITSVYTATSIASDENVIVYIDGIQLANWEFEVYQLPEGTLLVDANKGNDATGDGSSSNPYKTIKTALDNLGTNTGIYVKGGVYVLDNYAVSSDVVITGMGNVVITTTSTGHMTIGNNNVNLTNLVFTGATSSSIIAAGDLNIVGSVFTGNSGDSIIKATAGNTNVKYTIFANNTVTKVIDAVTLSAEYNFWGDNNKPDDITATNWVIIDASIADIADDTLTAEADHDVTIKFVDNENNELSGNMHDFEVDVSADMGAVDTTATISNNIATVNYRADAEGADEVKVSSYENVLKTIAFTVVENQEGRIYVASSDYERDTTKTLGSKENPYDNLGDAIAVNEAGEGGNEIIVYSGTYAAYNKIITKDVTFTGRGNVIFDVWDNANNQAGYFTGYTGSTNHYVKVNNIIFTNFGRQTLLQYAKDFVVDNCTFVNATGTGKIIDPVTSGSILITNSVFENITLTSTSAPFSSSSYSASFTVNVTNSVFKDVKYSSNYLFSGTVVDVNGNFWGTNTPSKITSTSSALSNWAVASIDLAETIVQGQTPTLTVQMKLNDGSDLTKSLPVFSLGLTSLLENTFAPETVTISDNIGNVTYTAANNGHEEINLTSGDNVVVSIERDIEEGDDPSKIFVDETYTESDADGSKDKPFNNLKDALNAIDTTRNTVVILEGDYFISDYTLSNAATVRWSKKQVNITATNLVIASDVTFEKLVFKDGNTITVNNGASLTVANTTFVNNTAGITSAGDLKISESQFINTSNAVVATAGSVNIDFTEFVLSNGISIASAVTGKINDNYWGTKPTDIGGAELTSWIELVITPAQDEIDINASEKQTLTIAFKNTTNGGTFTDLAKDMPALDIAVAPAIGSVDKTAIILSNSDSFVYTATTEGDETISFKTEGLTIETSEFEVGTSVAGKIFVNGSYTGAVKDGSRLNPFTDVDSAISAAQSGNEIIIYEGTYTNTGYYNVGYKNLIFTGVGDVILTRTAATSSYSGGQLFTLNGYTYTFNNIIFANIDASNSYYSYGSVFYMNSYDPVTLNINNCTFANNTAKNGVIYQTNSYGYLNLNVQGTKFINNTASTGYLIQYYGGSGYKLTIENSAFIDNTYSQYVIFNRGSSYATVNLNNNFWGSNELPSDATVASTMPTTWVIVEASMDADTITSGETPKLILTFNSTDGETVSQLTKVMPDVELDLSAVLNTIDATVTISNNAGEVTYNAVKNGDEIITVKAGENVLTTLEFIVEETEDGKVFVNSASTSNETEDGSKAKPFKDLKDALEYAKEHDIKLISVAEGSYEIDDYTIGSDVEIYAGKTVTIKATGLTVNANNVTFRNLIFDGGNTITLNSGKNLTISDSTFTNNAGVIKSEGNLFINATKFINDEAIADSTTQGNGLLGAPNTEAKGIINALSGTLKISYSEFVGSTGGEYIVYATDGVTGDVENNFWGSNDEPDVSENIKPDSWVKLSVIIADDVKTESEYEITLKFILNDDSELDVSMPELDVDLVPTIGNVEPAVVTMVDNHATATYKSDVEGSEAIAILTDVISLEFDVTENEDGKIFVATPENGGSDESGDGSKAKPYATITKALSRNVALGGNQEIIVMEGTYSISSYYTISKNVKITGRGEVKLTTTGTSYLFYNNGNSATSVYNLTLTNLIIENVTSSNYAAIYYKGYYGYSYSTYSYQTVYSTLNLINCTFNNNKGLYGVVYGQSYALLNATGNTFYNNTATSTNPLIYASGNSFIFNYNILIDNNAARSYYGMVRGPTGQNVDYNFWGSNDKPTANRDYYSDLTLRNWVVVELAIDNDDLAVGDSATITAKFKYTADGETFIDLDKSMPTYTFDLAKLLGDVPETVTIENNVAEFTYTTVSQGDEVISLKVGDKEITNLTFYVDESPIGKIFVNEAYDGEVSNGSRNAPFKTIAEAIAKNAELGGNQTIVIKAGEYTLSEAVITDNLTIKADDGVVINSEGKTTLTVKQNANVTLINVNINNAKDVMVAEENTKLDIINSTFVGNNGVIVSNGATTVYRTLFKDNDGTVIKAEKGSLDVSYSAFVGNDVLIESEIGATANNNFWGTNDQTTIDGVTIDNWVIVDATLADAPDIFTEKTYDVDVKFTSNDGTDLADTLPDVELDINSEFGIIDSSVIISENEATVSFTTYEEGDDSIEFAVGENVLDNIPISAVEDESGRIYVATPEDGGSDESGDGSKANPYATISKALGDVTADKNEIIVFEGTYDTTTRYTINNNVQITGRGDVILTGEADYLFYLSGSYTLNLTGLTIDGFKSTGTYNRMIYVYGSSSYTHAKLNINDCILSNNEATLVYIYYADANIQHSTVINNNAGTSYLFEGYTYGSSYGTYTINYSNIINNTNSYYTVYAYGDVNYNYWGTNDESELPSVYSYATRDNFVIITLSISSQTLYVGDEYELTNVFKLNDGSDLEESMPDLAIDVSSDLGYAESFVISNNTGTTTFTVTGEGDSTVDFCNSNVKIAGLEINAVNPITVSVEKINEGEKLNITVNLITKDNGTANVTINGVEYEINLTNGSGNEIIEIDLLPGTYDVNAVFGNYKNTNTTTINLRDTNLSFEVNDIIVGQNATIKVIANPSMTGNITVYVNGKEYTATKQNNYTFQTDAFESDGEQSVVALFIGDDYHKFDKNSTIFNVNKLNTALTIDLSKDSIYADETITITVTVPDAEGIVAIKINNDTYYRAIKDSKVILENITLTAGLNNITASFEGNNKYDRVTNETNITVNKRDTKMDVTVNDREGEIYVNIEFESEVSGTVEFILNETVKYDVILLNKKYANYIFEDLENNTYNVTVRFASGIYNTIEESRIIKVDSGFMYVVISQDEVQKGDNFTVYVVLPDDAGGNVTVNGEYVKDVENGEVEITVPTSATGTLNVVVIYSGDDKYINRTSIKTITVIPLQNKISYNNTIKANENAIITITFADNQTKGNVSTTVNQITYNASINDGVAVLSIPNLNIGENDLEIMYGAETIFYAYITVETVSINEFDVTVKNNATCLSIELPDGATGNVTFAVDGRDYEVELNNNVASKVIPELSAGNHTIVIAYAGDGRFDAITIVDTVIVSKKASTIKANSSAVIEGQDVVVDVEVTNGAGGVVSVKVAGMKVYAEIISGKARAVISGVDAGNYTAVVSFDGDDEYLASNCTVDVNVSEGEIPKKIVINESDVTVNNNATCLSVVLPDGATGNVTFIVGDVDYEVELNNSVASKVIPELSAGSYAIVISYAGDSKYEALTFISTLKVSKKASTIKANSSAVIEGQDVVVDVEVTNGAGGVVSVKVAGKKVYAEIISGKARAVISGVDAGNYTAVVSFDGDDEYLASNCTVDVNVSEGEIPKKIVINESDVTVNNNATCLSVVLPDGATGNVTFIVGDVDYEVELNNSVASKVIPELSAGSYAIVISYAGDSKYEALTFISTLKVSKKASVITASADEISEGQTLVINIEITEGTSGIVSVEIDANKYYAEINNGKATVSVDGLKSGNHSALIKFSGDDRYLASKYTLPVKVAKVDIPADNALNIDVPVGTTTPSFAINLPSDATGTLTVIVDGKNYTANVVNGVASVDVSGLSSGSHDVSVIYSGDDKYDSISKNTTVSIPTIAVSGNDVNMLYTASAQYNGQLTSDGVGIANKQATLNINGILINVISDKNGYISYKIPTLSPGTYTATLTYGSIVKTNHITVNNIVVAKNTSVKKSKKVSKIKVSLQKVDGKYLKGKNLKLKLKGKTYKAKTNSKGVATFSIKKSAIKKLTAGKKYKYTVTYGGDSVTKKVTVKK